MRHPSTTGASLGALALLLVSSSGTSMRCKEENAPDPGRYSLEYEIRLGRDCFMQELCGERVEVDTAGIARYYQDRGTWELRSSDSLSTVELNELANLLHEVDFFSLPHRLPSEEIRPDGRIVEISVTDTHTDSTRTVLAAMEDTSSPMPESFATFESRLRRFLIDRFTIRQ